jgi:hypothetical protein
MNAETSLRLRRKREGRKKKETKEKERKEKKKEKEEEEVGEGREEISFFPAPEGAPAKVSTLLLKHAVKNPLKMSRVRYNK